MAYRERRKSSYSRRRDEYIEHGTFIKSLRILLGRATKNSIVNILMSKYSGNFKNIKIRII